jgi:hypothetical protein
MRILVVEDRSALQLTQAGAAISLAGRFPE